jgi:hypothetical protein
MSPTSFKAFEIRAGRSLTFSYTDELVSPVKGCCYLRVFDACHGSVGALSLRIQLHEKERE